MKKISFWVFLGSLLYVTISDISDHKDQYRHPHPSTFLPSSTMYISTPRGASKNIVLPDGSAVSLNAGSTLSYPSNMDTGDRIVKVFGEAFFSVATKSSRPFRVQAREMFVEVLGTRFNVRDYPEETCSKTFVVAGAIRISYRDSSAILRAGEEADIDPTRLDHRTFILKPGVDTTAMAEWMKGILSFSDIDLPSLLRELSRAYDVDIVLQGPAITHRFKGLVSVKEPLDQVIDRLIIPYVNVLIERQGKRQLIITVKS